MNMKKSKNFRTLAIIFLCAAMLAATALFSSCGGKSVGSGSTSFKLEITKADGTKTTYTVKTDDLTIGDALVSANLTSADSKTAGMITTLDGTTVDNTTQYWAFYVGGTYADSGVFDTNIASGTTYALKVESVPTAGAINPSDAAGGTSALS